jgi:uncharacterized protein (UPF0264 family)
MSFEFVTGAEFILANDAVAIFVTNTDLLPATTRIQVYENAVGGATLFVDSGVLDVAPTGTAAASVTFLNVGFYGVKIYASSKDLVPSVRFARLQGGQPVTIAAYSPGDFAVFERSRL